MVRKKHKNQHRRYRSITASSVKTWPRPLLLAIAVAAPPNLTTATRASGAGSGGGTSRSEAPPLSSSLSPYEHQAHSAFSSRDGGGSGANSHPPERASATGTDRGDNGSGDDDQGGKSAPASPESSPPPSPPVVIKLDFFNALFKLFAFAWLSSRGSPDSGGIRGLFETVLRGAPAHVVAPTQRYAFEVLNDRYSRDKVALGTALAPVGRRAYVAREYSRRRRRNEREIERQRRTGGRRRGAWSLVGGGRAAASEAQSREKNDSPPTKRTVVVAELDTTSPRGDKTGRRQIESFRDAVSFLLSLVRDPVTREELGELEVVLLLESPGGSVEDYGLAAVLIEQLRDEEGVKMTICVDKVAASGGYMIACQASPGCLLAAPFATVGSIGVVSQSFNLRDFLERWGIRPFTFRGGKDKRLMDSFAEVTKEDMKKSQEKVEAIHAAFRRHVALARPMLSENIDGVSTGEVWLARDALGFGLVDRLVASDEYIAQRVQAGDRVLRLTKFDRSRVGFGFSPLDLFLANDGGDNDWIRGCRNNIAKVLVDILPITGTGGALINSVRKMLSNGGQPDIIGSQLRLSGD